MLLKIVYFKYHINPHPTKQAEAMLKLVKLLEEEEENEYCKKARIQTVSIRSDNRERMFRKNRMKIEEGAPEICCDDFIF